MKSLILCDGSESSLRCVEVACATDASLILLHVWDKPATTTAAAAAAHTEGPSSPRSGAAAAAFNVGVAEMAAASSPQDRTAAAAAAGSPTVPCSVVLTSTLKALHTNKYIKGRAHYTIEAVCASADAGEYEGDAVVAAAAENTTQTTPTADTLLHGAPPPAITANGGMEDAAAVVVRHVVHQARRHAVDAVFLGVGQRQEGKQYRLGAVALRTLRSLRTTHPLYFVKKDGVKWRPLPLTANAAAAAAATTAPLCFTVVLPLPSSSASSCSDGDETSSSANEKHAAAASADAALLLPPYALKAAIDAAVRYAQLHCVRHGNTSASAAGAPQSDDGIAFILIAPAAPLGEDSSDAAGAAASPTEAAEAVVAAPTSTLTALEACRHYVEVLLPSSETSSASPATGDAVEEAQMERAKEEEAAQESDAAAPASRVSVCILKASKKHPTVTLADADVALPQVMKHVSALKPDVLLLPASLVPEALQCALLAASKPHCVIVPC